MPHPRWVLEVRPGLLRNRVSDLRAFYAQPEYEPEPRRIVGWAMAEHMRTELVTDALAMALHQRRPEAG